MAVDYTLHKKVGQRIKDLRKIKNVSQQDLAAMCDVEKSSMSRLEAGRTNATLATYEAVAKALGVEIIELFKY